MTKEVPNPALPTHLGRPCVLDDPAGHGYATGNAIEVIRASALCDVSRREY